MLNSSELTGKFYTESTIMYWLGSAKCKENCRATTSLSFSPQTFESALHLYSECAEDLLIGVVGYCTSPFNSSYSFL